MERSTASSGRIHEEMRPQSPIGSGPFVPELTGPGSRVARLPVPPRAEGRRRRSQNRRRNPSRSGLTDREEGEQDGGDPIEQGGAHRSSGGGCAEQIALKLRCRGERADINGRVEVPPAASAGQVACPGSWRGAEGGRATCRRCCCAGAECRGSPCRRPQLS